MSNLNEALTLNSSKNYCTFVPYFYVIFPDPFILFSVHKYWKSTDERKKPYKQNDPNRSSMTYFFVHRIHNGFESLQGEHCQC